MDLEKHLFTHCAHLHNPCIVDHIGILRISTTTNPQTDWCGLPEKVGGKKENQLNGMYPTHVAILVKITDLGKVTSCMHDVTSYWRLVKFSCLIRNLECSYSRTSVIQALINRNWNLGFENDPRGLI